MEADPGAPEASDSEHEVDSNASFGHETSGTSNDEEIFDGSSSQDESDAEQDAAGDGVATGDVHDAAADDPELRCDECHSYGYRMIKQDVEDLLGRTVSRAARRARSACMSSKSAAPGDVAVGGCAAG